MQKALAPSDVLLSSGETHERRRAPPRPAAARRGDPHDAAKTAQNLAANHGRFAVVIYSFLPTFGELLLPIWLIGWGTRLTDPVPSPGSA